jgi:hypothetical protein
VRPRPPACRRARGLIIAFYYGLTAFACPVYFRRQLLRSPRQFLTLGIVPLIGAGGLAWVFVRTAINLSHPTNSATHTAPLGIGLPLLLAAGLLLLGLLLLGLTAWRSPSFPAAWTAQASAAAVAHPQNPVAHTRCGPRPAPTSSHRPGVDGWLGGTHAFRSSPHHER